MSYSSISQDDMTVDEKRMKRATLTRDLISLKEACQKIKHQIEKMDLDNRYLIGDKNNLGEEVESKRGRMRAIENEVYQLERELDEKKKEKKTTLLEMAQMETKSAEIEGTVKKNEHDKEKLQDEIREMDREIKKLEVQIREM
ncbi:MAG TPA: hypothetical protein DDY52_00335 [Candidatus Moranbacteria bacterium]|nr:MAG: Chromosome segregation ATPase-like protein [Candidatus Moranbacteria bacterium GW2011_GWF1_34_10]HBI16596.1 hypothetical protein [Candidatus Moranbacteria bacterium]